MSAMNPTAVGFVGLGNIGRPMALRLAAGLPAGALHVHDVVPEPVSELEKAGAVPAAGLAALAAEVEVACVMVRDDDQVREVVAQLLGGAGLEPEAATGLATGGHRLRAIAVHSTISPHTAVSLESVARRHGVLLADAPVSGGGPGAAEGSLAILVGGTEEAFAAVEPVLRLMGTRVVHAGPIAAGTRMKLARNLLHFVAFTAVTEAQRLAEAADLDLVALGEVVRHTDAITGGPGAIMHRDTTAPLAPDDFWHGVFSHVVQLGEKDLTLALELADELGVDVPLARQALAELRPGLGLPIRRGVADVQQKPAEASQKYGKSPEETA